jgi:hypothetical protein
MGLKDLDLIYKKLNAEKIKNQGEKSLLSSKNTQEEALDLQLQIVEAVFSDRMAEKQANETAMNNLSQRRMLEEILADKEKQSLLSLTPAELQAKIAALSGDQKTA